MSVIKKSCSGRSDCDGMDDDSDDKDSKRKSRNLSEKKRRDQFNVLVNELSTMVSTGSGRKMDKSTVLKATIAFLKNHNEIAVRSRVHEIQENWKPSFLTNEEFTHLVLEAVDGFMIALGSNTGEILYISEGITSLLGYLPADVVGTTIYELGCEEEQNDLYNIITSPSDDERSVSFSCHLRRSNDDTKITPSYDLVHFIGYFRADCEMVTTDSSRYSGYSGDADNRVVFVGTGRLQIPHLLSEMRLLDTYSLPSLSTNPTLTITSSSCSPSRTPSLSSHTSHSHSASRSSEFISRHSLEWKFLYLDQRAPPIIGYLPIELLGTSGYDYYHVDDLERVVGCHDALLQKGEGTSCCYRFLTKGQQWLWLQTRFYITYHQWNSKPEFVVCTHRVVSYVDVLRQNRKQEDSLEILGDPLPLPENSTSLPWYNNKNTHNTKTHSKALSLSGFNHQHGASSDCTSMSADSPMSRHSGRTHISTKSKTNHNLRSSTSNLNLPTQSSSPSSVILPSPLITTTGNNCNNTGNSTVGVTVTSGTSSTDGFIEPATQYVTGIAAGVVVRHEPSSGLLQQCYGSGGDGRRGAQQQRQDEEELGGGVVRVTVGEQLPQVGDHFSMSIQHHHNDDQHTVQMQADLQRKHAELQAIIGQQQAELRRVSEQLLMSRLGILHQATSQATTHTTSTCYSAGAVSSTTSLSAPPVTPAGHTSPLSPVLSLATTTTATATHTPSILHSAPVYTTRNQQVND